MNAFEARRFLWGARPTVNVEVSDKKNCLVRKE
jgi:hypothetical protein